MLPKGNPGAVSVADILSLASVNLTQFASRAAVLCEMTRLTATGPFKVTQGYRFWY